MTKSRFERSQGWEIGRPSEQKNGAAIPTAGEIFSDGTVLDLLRDPASPEKLTLVQCQCGVLDFEAIVSHAGRMYEPILVNGVVARSIRFPTRVAPTETTKKLFMAVHELLTRHLGQLESCITGLVCAAFVSWMSPVLPMAPIFWIFAPAGSPRDLALQMLSLLSRRPLQLVGLRRGDMLHVPMSLQPTLLLDEPDLRPEMQTLLRSSSHRGARIISTDGLLEFYGPKIIVSDKLPHDTALAGEALKAVLIPITGRLPPLDKKAEEEIAEEFQARFVGHYLRNAASVRSANFDASNFTLPVQDLARTLGAAVIGDNELQKRILSLLSVQDEEVRADRARAGDAVVVEASLSFIHQGGWTKVRTDSIADRVSAIYKGRGSDQCPSAERVGRALKRLSIPSGRLSRAGNGIELTVPTCQLIHKLALAHGVLALSGALNGDCRYCRELEPVIAQAATRPDRGG